MSQVYAIPTAMEFSSEQELMKFEQENEINRHELFEQLDENGERVSLKATYLPQLALHLEDREGQLQESKKSKFYQVGQHDGEIKPQQLKWRGIFKVIPRSIIDSSQTLVKATKMEMFNMLVPLFQFPPQMVAKAANQIIKVNEEDPKDWLPDDWVAFLEGGGLPQPMMPGVTPGMPPEQPQAEQPIFVPAGGASMQGQAGMAPQQAQTIVPTGSIPGTPKGAMALSQGLFKTRL